MGFGWNSIPLCKMNKSNLPLNNDNHGTSFYENISNEYGVRTTKWLKRLSALNKKLAKAKSQRKFLLKCRAHDVRPKHLHNIKNNLKHITFISKTANKKIDNCIKHLATTILNIEIKDVNIHIRYMQKEIEKIHKKLETVIPDNILLKFTKTQEAFTGRIQKSLDSLHIKKFEQLVIESGKESHNRKVNSSNTHNNDNCKNNKWFFNMSSSTIPDNVIETVSLGQKYSVNNKLDKNSIIETIKNTEQLLDTYQISTETCNSIRTTLIENIETQLKKKSHISRENKEFAQKLKESKQFIKNNDNIMFTMADKGNVTVAIDKNTYKEKMYELLNDKKTYKIVKRNPLPKLQKDVHKIMSRWNNNNFLGKKFHNNSLTQTDTVLPKIYGLPKIHKKDTPLRPIVSCVGSPTYNLAKIIDKIISHNIPKAKSYIKNSNDLIKKIENCNIPDDHILVSFDVVSLFTNVPTELVQKAIEKRYQFLISNGVPLDELLEVSTFLMGNTFFQFEGQYYHQTYGCPMGSPISPCFADIVMVDHEEECLGKLDFKPIFYYRYVDDSIACIPKNKLNYMLNTFNSYHNSIKFTYECENNNSINFLELTIIKRNNKIITNWYRKPTFSGRVLHFNSTHPIQQKRAMVYTLVDKAILLAHDEFHNNNLKIVREFLLENSYPIKFIEFHVKKRLQKFIYYNNQNNENNNLNNANRTIATISIPYIPQFFDKVKCTLKRHNFKTVPKINNKLNSIVKRGKDKQEDKLQTNIVYKIDCNDCNASYIGESKRQLQCRLKEHQSNTQKDDKHYVINEHMTTYNHTFNFNDVKILDKESHWKKRLISEMLHIKLQPNAVNIKEDTQKLSIQYNHLINQMNIQAKKNDDLSS